MEKTIKLKAQIYRGAEIAMGPGKAALLDAIVASGSISAAGRHLGMSYRRAWMLVDTMNRCWASPLVETSPQGAVVTPLGHDILAAYRTLTAQMETVGNGNAARALIERLAATDE